MSNNRRKRNRQNNNNTRRNAPRKRNRGTSNQVTRRVSQPTARSTQVTNKPRKMREIRLKHMEFVQDIARQTEFGMQHFNMKLNPGREEVFPWGHRIANAFESYKVNTFKIHFITAAPTSLSGWIAVCPDFDAADDNTDSDKKRLLAFEDTKRTPIWQGMVATLTPKNCQKMKQFFVRSADLGTNLDIKTYDFCQLEVIYQTALAPGGDGESIGELWFEYDITFFTPQYEPHVDNDGGIQQKSTQAQPVLPSALWSSAFHGITLFGDTEFKRVTDQKLDIVEAGRYLLMGLVQVSGVTGPITSIVNMDATANILPHPDFEFNTLATVAHESFPIDTIEFVNMAAAFVPGTVNGTRPFEIRWDGLVEAGGTGWVDLAQIVGVPISKRVYDFLSTTGPYRSDPTSIVKTSLRRAEALLGSKGLKGKGTEIFKELSRKFDLK